MQIHHPNQIIKDLEEEVLLKLVGKLQEHFQEEEYQIKVQSQL